MFLHTTPKMLLCNTLEKLKANIESIERETRAYQTVANSTKNLNASFDIACLDKLINCEKEYAAAADKADKLSDNWFSDVTEKDYKEAAVLCRRVVDALQSKAKYLKQIAQDAKKYLKQIEQDAKSKNAHKMYNTFTQRATYIKRIANHYLRHSQKFSRANDDNDDA